jgi:2-polyprenyl-6-methoxyphenol hydroxylase-like FAD-dependent oxidoreductase
MAAASTVRMMGASRRAGGLHSRTIEVLDQRGIADRFLAQGQAAQIEKTSTHPRDRPGGDS